MSALKPRTNAVTILQGDDIETIAELQRAYEIARRRESTENARGGDVSEAQAAKEALEAATEEAIERAVVVHIKHIPRKRFRALMAEHKPREGVDEDEAYGVNFDTFADVFLPLSVANIEGPEPVTDIVGFLDDLPEGAYNKVFTSAYYLNRGPGADPFELRFSLAHQSSTEN